MGARKIGFIGTGNMGQAIAKAVAKQSDVSLLFSDHNLEKASLLQAELGGQILSNYSIASQADIIFLGVKPHLLVQILSELREAIAKNEQAIWISMVAGVTLDDLSAFLPRKHLVRMMPNTPVAIGQGMTTYCVKNKELESLFEELLSFSGKVQVLPESLMDSATAIAGCGPAFAYQMIEAMMDAGIAKGLSVSMAKYLAAQTLLGSAQMVLESDTHPAQLRHEVTSPGGATIAGVIALEEEGLRHALIKAIMASYDKTQLLRK